MNNKVRHIFLVAISLIPVLLLTHVTGYAATPVAPITLKIASARPNTDVQLKSIEWWASEVEKRTSGAVTFRLFWAGSLVKAKDELESLRSGLIDLAPVTVGDYPSRLPMANVFYAVPFGPDQEVAGKIADTLYNEFPAMQKEIEQCNQKILYFLPTPTYDIGSMMPLKMLDDFKGKKIIVLGKNMSDWITAVGAAPVAVPAPERYMALKTGVADAEVFPFLSIHDFKHGEVLRCVTEVGLGAPITWYFAINRDSWNKMSPEIQKTMETTAREAALVLVNNANNAKAGAKKALQTAGVTFYTMSAADKQRWANLMKDLPAQWANDMKAQGQPGWEIVGRLIALAKASGHTFPREWAQQK